MFSDDVGRSRRRVSHVTDVFFFKHRCVCVCVLAAPFIPLFVFEEDMKQKPESDILKQKQSNTQLQKLAQNISQIAPQIAN